MKQFGNAIKRPIPVSFFHWKGMQDVRSLSLWILSLDKNIADVIFISDHFIRIKTLEGTSYDVPDDYYIVQGNSGEFWPVKGSIFRDTYQELD